MSKISDILIPAAQTIRTALTALESLARIIHGNEQVKLSLDQLKTSERQLKEILAELDPGEVEDETTGGVKDDGSSYLDKVELAEPESVESLTGDEGTTRCRPEITAGYQGPGPDDPGPEGPEGIPGDPGPEGTPGEPTIIIP